MKRNKKISVTVANVLVKFVHFNLMPVMIAIIAKEYSIIETHFPVSQETISATVLALLMNNI